MKFCDDVGNPLYFPSPFPIILSWLSTLCFIQTIFAIKCQSRQKPNKCKRIVDSNFLGEQQPRFFYCRLLARFTVHHLAKSGWVPFADLRMSVCEAWLWRRMQNLRRVGKNSGPILSRLWTNVQDILRQCRRPLVVSNAFIRLCISCFS